MDVGALLTDPERFHSTTFAHEAVKPCHFAQSRLIDCSIDHILEYLCPQRRNVLLRFGRQAVYDCCDRLDGIISERFLANRKYVPCRRIIPSKSCGSTPCSASSSAPQSGACFAPRLALPLSIFESCRWAFLPLPSHLRAAFEQRVPSSLVPVAAVCGTE